MKTEFIESVPLEISNSIKYYLKDIEAIIEINHNIKLDDKSKLALFGTLRASMIEGYGWASTLLNNMRSGISNELINIQYQNEKP